MFRLMMFGALLVVGAQAHAGGFGAGLLLGRAIHPRVVVVDRGFDRGLVRDIDDGCGRAVVVDRGFRGRSVVVRNRGLRGRAVVVRGRGGCGL